MYEDIGPQCIGIPDCRSSPNRRAVNDATAAIQNVPVDHCHAHVFVSRVPELANIVTVLKQVSGE